MSNDTNLRPYYDPESFNAGYGVIYKRGVGLIDTTTNKPITSTLSSIHHTSSKIGIGLNNLNKTSIIKKNVSKLVENDKNIYSDLEFFEYFDLSNIHELVRNLLSSFVKNYSKVLMNQPIEIVRLLIQVGDFKDDHKNSLITSRKNSVFSGRPKLSARDRSVSIEETEDDQSDDEINYFLSPEEMEQSSSLKKSPRRRSIEPKPTSSSAVTFKNDESNAIHPLSNHTIDIMSSILAKEGITGLWRGINASFIYNTLSSTIEAWITGFLSPFLSIPDPFFLDVTHSPDPTKSLMLSIAATVITGIILSPLDLVRTKLIITSFKSKNERSIRECIKNMKSLIIPPSLILPTIFDSLSSIIFRKGTPYLLFIKFNIDSYSSPILFSTINVICSFLELFIKLPAESILRKNQVSYLLNSKEHVDSLTITKEDMIVEYNETNLWETDPRSLFNGWRVGLLNVIGYWGLRIIRSNNDMREEKL